MQTLAPTWNLGNTATIKRYVRLFPSLNDLAFLLPLFLLFARLKGTHLLFSDGDTGWHIRTGEWILAHHAVPRVDLFSFTKSNQPWFAWEWAWDISFAAIHACTGLAGVAFVNTLLLGLFTLLVYRLALRLSNNHFMSIVVTVLTAGGSSIHWLARPHLCTWIFILIFLHVIQSAQNGDRRLLKLLPLLVIPWVNLHGGFVAGLLIIGCYALGETLSSLLAQQNTLSEFKFECTLRSAWQASAPYWQSLLLCLAATFINPYGWNLHRHIYAYLTDTELLDKIQEFQSISFHAGPAILFEVVLVLASFVIFSKMQKRQFAPVLLLCLWAHYALLSSRHIPIFMLIAAPFVAELLTSAVEAIREIRLLQPIAESISDITSDLRALEVTPRLHLLSAAALVVIAALFAVGQSPFAAEFNDEAFPVQAIPVLQRHVGSRIFSSDQWSDYLLYRMYPAQRVFFDGRSDFYGNEFVKVNRRLTSAEHDWKTLLRQYAIQMVLLKPEEPLSAALKLTSGSKVLFDDGKVILFDITGIFASQSQTSLGTGDPADRAASSPSTLQSSLRAGAVTLNHATHLQKGKTSS